MADVLCSDYCSFEAECIAPAQDPPCLDDADPCATSCVEWYESLAGDGRPCRESLDVFLACLTISACADVLPTLAGHPDTIPEDGACAEELQATISDCNDFEPRDEGVWNCIQP